ncbi:hypothetical protein [Mycolicibacterium aubagnense]|uniref:Uncharacterized protein n=1 Tax=Mycolicibacterium aubagnense TaxID=319707 RepID=A0ABN5Z1U8_9MYCO|nr:hypothetical protein [Mycolicibacterium aubagnense]TLH48565.1 hypothetical protein C1S80_29745 [Mycolicibacterium aubagnense]BBX87968.1 hypothetical protein MAUB_58410 [Mycolicibacterium aubagnense]
MQITVAFTDVYDGEEHEHTETFDVPVPSDLTDSDQMDDWAGDNILPRTGDGNAVDKEAGYYAKVTECADLSDLVGREFEWHG